MSSRAQSSLPDRPLLLLSDAKRMLVATALMAVPTCAIIGYWMLNPGWASQLVEQDRWGFLMVCYALGWMMLALFHSLLTWLAFRGLEDKEFDEAIVADPSWQRWVAGDAKSRMKSRIMGTSTGSWTISISILALWVVLMLVLRPSLRQFPAALLIGTAMIVASWVSVAVLYGVRYARLDKSALRFPGDQPNKLSDYLYLSFAAQASFSPSDVEILTSEARRVVTGHTLLAFAFNSVILATVVSLLLGVG
ncbi:MAG: DUF1345 domain-containing protein [Ancrocorticia sp.]